MPSVSDRVRPFELFFDLVFAFSLIQITNSIVADNDLLGVIHGIVVLAIVWFVWVSFTALANIGLPPNTRRDWRPLVFITAMGLMLLVDISIPTAFWDNDQLFAYAIGALFVLWLAAFVKAVGHNRELRRDVLVTGMGAALLPAMLIVSTYVASTLISVILLLIGLMSAVTIPVLSRYGRWPIGREHLTERYELFMIIVLGETLISIGLGATRAERTPQLIIAVLIAVAVVAVLWRTYLMGVANAGRVRLQHLSQDEAWRFMRIAYLGLHFVLAAGIILIAAGFKVSMEDVLTPVAPLFAGVLICGLITFLLAIMLFRFRATGHFEWWRLIPLLGLLLAWFLAGRAPDIVFLGTVMAITILGSIPDLKLTSPERASHEDEHSI